MTISIYIEILILYVLLFFGISVSSPVSLSFSVSAGLSRIFFFHIPSLALIGYLLNLRNRLKLNSIKPQKKDLYAFFLAYPGLFITGIIIGFVSSYAEGSPSNTVQFFPTAASEWVILCLSCISAAYLEEYFFRYYMLTQNEALRIKPVTALILSTAMFSVCHIYEGPWGFLNSVISGAFLAFIFLRYKTIHGIAAAHAFYNITIYLVSSV